MVMKMTATEREPESAERASPRGGGRSDQG